MTEKQINTPLSNYDLMRGISRELKERANIVDVREIDKYKTVDELFDNRGHAILFEPPEDTKSDVGHWTCLLRTKKEGNCIYFDSYGNKLNNSKLRNLLKTKYPEIQYNPIQLQGYGTSVCGRYALVGACLNKIIPDLNIKKILEFYKNKPKGITYDEYVSNITGKI